jgi:polysaccharide export outer membrane protein
LLVGLVAWLTACSAPVDEAYLRYAQMSFDANVFNQLGVGDVIELRVFRQDDMDGEYSVTQDGLIRFPLIGQVAVLGRSCDDVAEEIENRLSAEYFRDPTVSCQVKELNSLRVVVSGEVKSPGRFPYADSLTVVEAVALAQGLTDNASADRVVITRLIDDIATEIVVPFRQILAGRAPNFRLWPNDIVTVPSFRLLP